MVGDQVSLTQQIQPIDLGAAAVHAAFLDGTPAVALADGVVWVDGRKVEAHPGGAVLTAASDERWLITGGDDGRIVATGKAGPAEPLAEEKGRWIDAVATREGAVAWSAGKQVRARDSGGAVKSWSAPTTARGLGFLPKGYRLAIAHYNGVSLWFPNASAEPQMLEWKGSHLDVTASPDGRFIVTSMQENALHGWRLSDSQHMRMSGYPAKTESFAFTRNGKWLASAGAECVVLWPFTGGGPMGKAPMELAGGADTLCVRVACHPQHDAVAAGFSDGLVVLADIPSERILPVAAPGRGVISALAWNADGSQLAFGTETGFAAVIDFSKR